MLHPIASRVKVTIAAFILCALLPVGIFHASFGRPAVFQRQADSWGEGVDGVQLRLAAVAGPANAPAPTAVDLPRFEAQIRNQGNQRVTFNPAGITLSANIEIDGVWYGALWGGSCCPAPQEVAPGSQSSVYTVVFQSRPLELGPGNKGLSLRPGRHSVRLRTASGDRFAVTVEGSPRHEIVLISNMITIDVPDVPAAVERQALIDAVSRGGGPGEPLRKLIEKYPEAAVGAVEAALGVTDNAFDRGFLISWLAPVQGAGVTAFLRSRLGPGSDFPSRSAAAWLLFQRSDPQAVPATVAAWRDIQPTLLSRSPVQDAGARMMQDAGTRFAVGGFITILAESGDAGAIDTLARNFLQEPLDVRMSIVGVFLSPETGPINVMLNGGPVNLPGGEAGLSIERLLITALDDREQRVGMKGAFNGVSYADPRICDMAALVFSTRWPAKYSFRWSVNPSERDTQIEAIRSAWRAEHPLG